MATTMTLIAKQTVGSGGAASVTFSNIPQTYTDLKLVMSVRGSASGTRQNVLIQLNGSGSNFTWLGLYGYSSSVGSNTTSNNFAGNVPMASNTANTFGTQDIYIPNYTSSTAAKSLSIDYAVENNGTDNFLGFDADLWNPGTQAPVTSITLSINSSGNFVEFSTFYLYGISSNTTTQNTTVPYASGGDIISTDGSYWYHTFLYSGTFTPLKNLTCDYLVVAGGGGGAGRRGGGAGAGGLRSTVTATGGGGSLETPLSLTTEAYTVVVGAGGTGGQGGNPPSFDPTKGSNSIFASITSNGGGVSDGGSGNYGTLKNGGSGGGGEAFTTGGTGTANQGRDGGSGNGNAPNYPGGGGGGASTAGQTAPSGSVAGAGGSGVTVAITGSSVTYAGGGGGGTYAGGTAGAGGAGGGGAGSNTTATATSGSANTGGGGGGGYVTGGNVGYNGGNGGSGIIIVRYAV